MAQATLKSLIREEKRKQAVKRLRHQGFIPGILYGSGIDPTPLTIDHKELLTLLHTVGRNTVVNLSLGDQKKKIKTFIFDIQHDPISGDIIHVDLKQISMKEKIHVTVPIHLTGIPEGVRNEGGIIEHILHTLEISCLPLKIPEEVSVDITDMHVGDVIHVRDLTYDTFDILSDEESVIVHIIAPKIAKVPEAEVLIEEEEEPGEPEVIGEEE